jgi:hypothetical protein
VNFCEIADNECGGAIEIGAKKIGAKNNENGI